MIKINGTRSKSIQVIYILSPINIPTQQAHNVDSTLIQRLESDQMPQNAVSDPGLHCSPIIQELQIHKQVLK